jgi:hypothetical protein
MGTPWNKERRAQFRSRHPAVDRAESRRLAQARFRQRHAKQLTQVRAVAAILMRQSGWFPPDIRRLAAKLQALLGKENAAALRRQLPR